MASLLLISALAWEVNAFQQASEGISMQINADAEVKKLVRTETDSTSDKVINAHGALHQPPTHDAAGNDLTKWMASPASSQWSSMPAKQLHEMLEGWYGQYGADLEKARAKARLWQGHPQSDDLEMSISYLRLRAHKPASVWECAPADGWSSLFILQALQDNGVGHLYSFGLEKEATVFKFMNSCCSDLSDRWSYKEGFLEKFIETYDFEQGQGGFTDSKGYQQVPLPQYVYMDALHTYDFGANYAKTLLSKLPGHVHFSMHDAFRDGWGGSTPEEREIFKAHPKRPMPEAQGVIDTLGVKICKGFTVSKSYSAEDHEAAQAIFDKFVKTPKLNAVTLNPTFYFELGTECA